MRLVRKLYCKRKNHIRFDVLTRGAKMLFKRIPGLPKPWQYFGGCVILHMIFPLFPLLLEDLFTNTISLKSMTLAACMYSFSIGLSSRNWFFFTYSLVISLFFAVIFGMVSARPDSTYPFLNFAWFAIIFVFLTHIGERYNIHVMEEAPYPLFMEGEQN